MLIQNTEVWEELIAEGIKVNFDFVFLYWLWFFGLLILVLLLDTVVFFVYGIYMATVITAIKDNPSRGVDRKVVQK